MFYYNRIDLSEGTDVAKSKNSNEFKTCSYWYFRHRFLFEYYDFKILIDADDKFPDGIILKNVLILMTCVIKDDGNFCQQIILEEALYV